jgi:hypothetical protein
MHKGRTAAPHSSATAHTHTQRRRVTASQTVGDTWHADLARSVQMIELS